jgi:hypothetical protein
MFLFMLWTDIRLDARWPAFFKLSGVGGLESLLVTRPTQCNTIGYARFYSRSRDAVIRVCDDADNVIEAHA